MHPDGPTETAPLAGLKVLEIGGGIAAAACTRLLRGFGASTTRTVPSAEQLDADEQIFYLSGSRNVTGDLASLIAEVDVVIEDQPPGWMAAQGVDPVQLRLDRPELVIGSITPFGQNGPHAQWQTTNAVQFAVGGIMSLTGEPDRPPLVTGGNQALLLGGLHAFSATITVLLGQLRTGRGDWVDVSMQESAASMLELYASMSEYETHEPTQRAGNSVRSIWGVYPCADGWAGVCCLERQVPAFFALLGDDVVNNPDFADTIIRRDHDDELTAHVLGFMLDHTKDELLDLSPKTRVPFGAVRTPLELLSDASFVGRGFFDRVTTPVGDAVMPGRPFPGLGWTAPGQDPVGEPWPTTPSASTASRPLEGLRVLDLTMMWAGPYATKLMAECGAEVIKIESPSAWDNIRTLVPQDPTIADPWNSAYYFNEYNHSKKSLTLDLATDRGRQLLLGLVADADVVIENYRADVLDKLGLSYEVLRKANEDIVLISMGGFGKTGPLSGHVGFGPIIEMMSGLVSLTGYGPGEDVPYKTGISYGDPVGGLHAIAATSLSLIQRQRTGHGRHVDMAQTETAASMAGPAFVAASTRGEVSKRRGNRSASFAPQGCYPTEGEDAWAVISVRTDTEWVTVCELIDRLDLASLSFAERVERHDELDEVLSGWTSQRTAAAVATTLQGAGVPAGPVQNSVDIHDDPQLVSRGFWVWVPHETMHPYRQTGQTWRLADAPVHEIRRAPFFGEHNDEILREAGLDTDALEVLEAAAVIATAPINPGVG